MCVHIFVFDISLSSCFSANVSSSFWSIVRNFTYFYDISAVISEYAETKSQSAKEVLTYDSKKKLLKKFWLFHPF